MPSSQYRQTQYAAPTGATELVLVRHGESAPAVLGEPFDLVDGQGDPDLAPAGRAQAERVGEALAARGFDAVYVTTLRRTAQTAAPLLAALGMTAVVERDFREVHLGEWEGGLFRVKVAEADPVAQRMFAEQRWDVIPGAESADALTERLRGVVARVNAAHPGGRVAVFTHGGVIAHLLHLASGSAPFAFLPVDNAAVSRLVVTGGAWQVRSYNETSHLA